MADFEEDEGYDTKCRQRILRFPSTLSTFPFRCIVAMCRPTISFRGNIRFDLLAFVAVASLVVTNLPRSSGADWPQATKVDRQPLQGSVDRLAEALQGMGTPLSDNIVAELTKLKQGTDDAVITQRVQELLDPLCLAAVHINPESRVHVLSGPAVPKLMEKGWRTYLIKVHNQGGVTAPLRCMSPQALPMVIGSSSKPKPESKVSPAEADRRWLEISVQVSEPLRRNLSGLELEYRILQLYSRDAGKREATLQFDVGQGTQDLGFRNELPILFDCVPSRQIPIQVRDDDGKPTTCSLIIRDDQGRVYPHPARRLAPDFFFHHQIYRADGENVILPPGTYRISAHRGPEYHPVQLQYTVPEKGEVQPLAIQLKRWIHMAQLHWISGDHHVHAAGCAHYENPTEGVTPQDMLRHILGEDLNVGCVLSWGPCWYHQKQFFDGQTSTFSNERYLMRYDVEVSGFPSSHAGHLCLLNLKEDDYPGTSIIEEWPSWTLPVLQWGKQQGGVVGYSHSGWGLMLPDYLPNGKRGALPNIWGGSNAGPVSKAAYKLPDYEMPPFDGIGANEYIVTAVHDACDFISTVDTPAVWELNIWYHMLNCGFKTRISGETDFPCIYGERVGLGRVYVQMPPDKPLSYEPWVMGLKDGRSYVGDGNCHVSEFKVNGVPMGHPGNNGEASQVVLRHAGSVQVQTRIAAFLPRDISEEAQSIRRKRLDEKPYWHIERARMGESRKVPVELIVNGEVIATQEIEADGNWNDLKWDVAMGQSSWVCLRVFPSMHTNPIFVEVEGLPVRASLASAEWCRKAVDVCWAKKRPQIRPAEQEAAATAYEVARKTFDAIIEECKPK